MITTIGIDRCQIDRRSASTGRPYYIKSEMNDRVVFLDKDGTLLEDIPYNVNPQLMRLAPGVLEGLQTLHAASYRLVVVTNQSGVARGYFSEGELAAVEKRLRELLAQGHVPLDGFYYCPHHPAGVLPGYAIHCSCRKPEPGLILRAAADLQVADLSGSWMIGDILHDVECGRRAGIRTILIDNGNETEWKLTPIRQPEFIVKNFLEAARIVVNGRAAFGRTEFAHSRREFGMDKPAG